MNIVVLSEQIPGSSSGAGCPRLHHIFEQLAAEHSVSLITSADMNSSAPGDLPGFIDRFISIPLPPKPGWLRKQLHRLALAPHLLQSYRCPEYVKATAAEVSDCLRELGADVLYVHGIAMSQYRPAAAGIPVVVDLVDSIALLYRRMAEREENSLQKLLMHIEAWSLARWEAGVASEADRTVVISDVDRAAILERCPEAKIDVVPNGVDFDFFRPQGTDEDAEALVFTGVMSYEPNAHAALWFAEQVFPLLRERRPDIQFWVVGKDPGTDVTKLAEQPGITVTGTVDDVRPYLERGKLFISPLQLGSGMKNKILNAMAMRRPIVASPLSIEGIEVESGTHLALAQSPDEWCSNIQQLLEDEQLRQDMAAKGFQLVTDRYSWQAGAKILENVFKESIENKGS